MKDAKLVSFVIPCYRSELTVRGVADEIRETMRTLPDWDWELVLINDCSPDGTFEVLRSLAEEDAQRRNAVPAPVYDANRLLVGQLADLAHGLRHQIRRAVLAARQLHPERPCRRWRRCVPQQ